MIELTVTCFVVVYLCLNAIRTCRIALAGRAPIRTRSTGSLAANPPGASSRFAKSGSRPASATWYGTSERRLSRRRLESMTQDEWDELDARIGLRTQRSVVVLAAKDKT